MRNIFIKPDVGSSKLLQKKDVFENKLELEIGECNSQINNELTLLIDNLSEVSLETNNIIKMFNKSSEKVVEKMKEFDQEVGDIINNE